MILERLPLTGLPVGHVPASVIVCGDPDRSTRISTMLDEPDQLSDRREYRCYAGLYENKSVAVCSHGIGAPAAAIAFEELITAGARRIIRVGTCGGLQEGLEPGHLVVATAAVQYTGYGREVAPSGFPAVADIDVARSLLAALSSKEHPFSAGIVLTRDGFYQRIDLPSSPDYQQMSHAGVLAVEMECAALFIVASLRGVQSGAVLVVDGNVLSSGGESMANYRPDNPAVHHGVEFAARTALEAIIGLTDEFDR